MNRQQQAALYALWLVLHQASANGLLAELAEAYHSGGPDGVNAFCDAVNSAVDLMEIEKMQESTKKS